MPARGDAIVVGDDGEITASGDALKACLRERAGRYRLLPGPGPWLMLQPQAATAKPARVLLAGEIVTRATVLEIVSVIGQNRWQGELTIHGKGSCRTLVIADGALKAAASRVPSERLGEVMVETGLINPEQLARCVLDVSPQRRFGEIAVDEGFVTHDQLLQALTVQMQRIFQNALLEEEGHYLLVKRDADDEAAHVPVVPLHVPIQGLLMESVQRIDEMAFFRERIPSGDVRPQLTGRLSQLPLADSVRPVAELSDGEHSIHEMARILRLDEYETTKRVAQLLQVGIVELRAQRALDVEAARRMVLRFNQILRFVFETVARHGGNADLRWTLDAWIRDTRLSSYFEGALTPAGTIEVERTLAKLREHDAALPLEGFEQALHELAAFAMLSAASGLPREAERTLSRLVSQKLAHLRRNESPSTSL